MKNRLIKILTAVFILGGISSAFAQDRSYISLSGSYGFHNKSDLKFKHKDLAESYSTTIDYKNNFGGAIAIGRIVDQFRFELEASYRKNNSKVVYFNKENKVEAVPTDVITGNASLMLNAYYDMPVSECVSFYIGAGAGVSSVRGDFKKKFNLRATKDHTFIKELDKKGHIDAVFAWQVMAGLTYHIDENWELFGGYRFFATNRPHFAKVTHRLGSTEYKDIKLTQKNIPFSNNVEFGMRLKF